MSFALQYRKKLQQQQRQAWAVKKANEGFVSMPAETSTDTSNNRRRVFLALMVAGGILAVFNSGGLVNYTQGLASNPVGPGLIIASERWHELMQEKQVTRVVDHIRGSLALARESSWQDLTFGFQLSPGGPHPVADPQPKIEPAREQTPAPPQPEPQETAKPDAPVMRASVERF